MKSHQIKYLLIFALLSGCGAPHGQEDGGASPPSAGSGSVGAGQKITKSIFPAAIQPSFPYKIRSQKVESDGRHKLVIEFKTGTVASTDKAVEQLLVSKGYSRSKSLKRNDGMFGDYGKNGSRVSVTTNPADGRLNLAPDSIGSVYFVWKI